MQRINVVGTSGSGKSTLSHHLAERLDLPHVELDALHHGENWTPREKLADDVAAATAGDHWVVDGNYTRVRELYWPRLDTIIWVDPPRHVVMRQVIGRTFKRIVTRAELWNGNKERLHTVLRASHPIRWAWVKHGEQRQIYPELFAALDPDQVTVHRLQSRAQIRELLASL